MDNQPFTGMPRYYQCRALSAFVPHLYGLVSFSSMSDKIFSMYQRLNPQSRGTLLQGQVDLYCFLTGKSERGLKLTGKKGVLKKT